MIEAVIDSLTVLGLTLNKEVGTVDMPNWSGFEEGAVALKISQRFHSHDEHPLVPPRSRQDWVALTRASTSAWVPLNTYKVEKNAVAWDCSFGLRTTAPKRCTSVETIVSAKESITLAAVVKFVKSYCE